MMKRLITDFSDHVNIDINASKNQRLTDYYIKFKEIDINTRGGNKPLRFDNKGIPLVHSYIDVENPGYNYYPITIGQVGLAVFHSYLVDKDESKKHQFLNIAAWFFENAVKDEKLGAYWLTDVDKPEYKMFQPWKSAFSQSRGISILLRAWQLNGNDEYLEVAKLALKPFLFDTSEGGVRVDNTNRTFYEEYVASAPTRILDGAIFSLFGLFDMIRVIKGIDNDIYKLSTQLFDQGVEGLVSWLPEFDMGYWVYYNRCEIEDYPQNDPCTIGYLRLVVSQLSILHQLTDNADIKYYGDKFQRYFKPLNILRMYRQKYLALKSLNRL